MLRVCVFVVMICVVCLTLYACIVYIRDVWVDAILRIAFECIAIYCCIAICS